MARYSIKAPNGKTYTIEGPDGASQDQVQAAVLAQYPDADKRPNLRATRPGDARSALAQANAEFDRQTANLTPDQKAAGRRAFNADPRIKDLAAAANSGKPKPPVDNSALRGLIGGILKPLDNLTSLAMKIPGMEALDRAGQAIGLPSASAATAGNQAARANNTRTGWQTLGNIAGTLPTAILPGGALVQGGASGALLSDSSSPEGVITDAATGAITGKAGDAAFTTLSKLAKPAVTKAGQALYDAGVPQTLGQIASQGKGLGSRFVTGAEEMLTSVPGVGHLINQARDRGTEGFNLALGNRALGNVKESLPAGMEPGGDMVKYVGKRLGERYDALVPKLVANADQQFATDMMAAKTATNTLPDAIQDQFAKIIEDTFANRIKAGKGQLKGQALKDAESSLTSKITQYRNSTNPDQRLLAEALDQSRQAFRGMIERSNPQFAGELQALNKGWAQSKQLRAAANAPGNATGVVTPAQMLAATRKGPEDAFVKSAKAILPNRTPNSGTADRAAMMGLLGTLGAGGVAGTAINPALAIPAAPALAYTKAGQTALNKLVFGERPEAVKQAAKLLEQAAKYSPAVIPALTQEGP